ncbi:MAG TPA: WD40 repeat domain-containing protein [Aggregatilineales bacterium]|nr:WD40 repeat domain-containing protein [Aggregatilineales bacterium]
MRHVLVLAGWLVGTLTGLIVLAYAPKSWYCAPPPVTDMRFISDGSSVAVDRLNGYGREVWSLDGGAFQSADYHAALPYLPHALAYSADQKRVLLSSDDGTAEILDQESGKELQRFPFHAHNPVSLVAFAPDEKTILIAGTTDHMAEVRDAQSGDLLQSLTNYPNLVMSIAYSPDSRTIATGNTSSSIWLWNAGTGETIQTLISRTNPVIKLLFSPDGSCLLTADAGRTVQVWDVRSGRLLFSFFTAYPITQAAFSPDGRFIATASYRFLQLWDGQTGAAITTRGLRADWVSSLAYAPDGKTLAIGVSDEPTLIDAQTGETIRVLCPRTLGDDMALAGGLLVADMGGFAALYVWRLWRKDCMYSA